MVKNKDFILTIQRGGMMDFEKTGVYPEFLLFHSASLERTWRFKLKEEKQKGVLKVNGQIAFRYCFDGLGCKMESVVDGVVAEEWEIEEFAIEFRDR